jgi:hypothetical protein
MELNNNLVERAHFLEERCVVASVLETMLFDEARKMILATHEALEPWLPKLHGRYAV